MAKKIESIIPSFLKSDEALSFSDRYRLKKLKRFEPASLDFYGKKIKIADVLTFRSSYHEIFKQKIYYFESKASDPVIIDCGANIGLSTIYFKKLFPSAKVVAFEPDPLIFSCLSYNIQSFGFTDVLVKNEAVSNYDGVAKFYTEGGHSGKISEEMSPADIEVNVTRLRSVLEKYDRICFLKIDIEGEEAVVIPDIAEQLKKVDYLFLEYHSSINQPQTLPEILEAINSAGMRYYIEHAINKHLPFVNKEIFLGMDMLINIFCYR